jgi:enoyl-CoA hydratase
LTSGTGSLQRLARSVGMAKALELQLDAKPLDADEAERHGVVNRVVAPDQLLREATLLAERLARRSPQTTGAIKRALYKGTGIPFWRSLTLDQATYASTAGSRAPLRALKAYDEELASADSENDFPIEAVLERWHQGTAVDLVADAPHNDV